MKLHKVEIKLLKLEMKLLKAEMMLLKLEIKLLKVEIKLLKVHINLLKARMKLLRVQAWITLSVDWCLCVNPCFWVFKLRKAQSRETLRSWGCTSELIIFC